MSYESPYSKEETEGLIDQINELRGLLSICWSIVPDGDFGEDHGVKCVRIKRGMTAYQCWPQNLAYFDYKTGAFTWNDESGDK